MGRALGYQVFGLILLFLRCCVPSTQGQTPEDSSRIEELLSGISKSMFADRVQTLLRCDSVEALAKQANWVKPQITALAARIESANVFGVLDDMQEGLIQMDTALERYRPQIGPAHASFWEENQYNWGAYYAQTGDIAKSQTILSSLKQLLEQKSDKTKETYRKLFATDQYIAGNYERAGDFQKAIQHYRWSLDHRQRYHRSPIGYVNALYKIGDIFLQQKQFDKALDYYLQALDSLKQAVRADGPDKWFAYRMNIHRRLGLFYANQDRFNLAFEHFQEALAAAKPGTPFLANLHDNMAEVYGKMRDVENAAQHLGASLAIKQKLYGSNSPQVAETCLVAGKIFYAQGQLQEGLRRFQQALSILGGEDLDESGLENPKGLQKGQTLLFLQVLRQKLFALDQLSLQAPARIDLLQCRWETSQLALKMLGKLRSEYSSNTDKQFLLNDSKPIFEQAIACALQLDALPPDVAPEHGAGTTNFVQMAFSFAEQTKSLLLYEGVQESNALRFSEIPDSLLHRERTLRAGLAYWEKRRFDYGGDEIFKTRDSILSGIGRSLERLQIAYHALKKKFEIEYPDYYRLKYELRVADVASVQRELLGAEQALVEYFIGDSTVYIFVLDQQRCHVEKVKKNFPLEQWVTQLRHGVTAFFANPNMANFYDSLSVVYTDAATNIYEKLVAPISSKLPKEVVFVPDGILGYVPFEALLVEKPPNRMPWNQCRYLLQNHQVSYCYSSTMLREMRFSKHKQVPDLHFLGFAPHYYGDTALLSDKFPYTDDIRKDFRPLPHSGEEVYLSAQIMKGQYFTGTTASESAFMEWAPRARILHLATHGQANDRAGDYSFLVFAEQKDSAENEILYARDIYNLQLNADLVTLSACETGIGELQRGEGIISLARAFALAGAKSIVTTLWSVSDAKTKDLMLDFYRNLRKGQRKDAALRQAKLDFLKRNKGAAAHPFYWAGFVGLGDMKSLR